MYDLARYGVMGLPLVPKMSCSLRSRTGDALKAPPPPPPVWDDDILVEDANDNEEVVDVTVGAATREVDTSRNILWRCGGIDDDKC